MDRLEGPGGSLSLMGSLLAGVAAIVTILREPSLSLPGYDRFVTRNKPTREGAMGDYVVPSAS